MFETSVVRAHAQAAEGRLSLLTISLIAHSAVIIGAVAVSIASVDFPKVAPDENAHAPIFARVTIPPPLGTPDGGGGPKPKPAAQPQQPKPAVALPTQPVAPRQVPDAIPDVGSSSTTSQTPVDGPPGTGEGNPGPRGVEGGDPNSIFNELTDVLPAPEQPGKIYEAHEVKAPVLIQRVEPNYPNAFRPVRLKVTVVVRCIIDKNGNVRDAEILRPGPPAFNAEVIDAVQKWRFTPGSLNGIAVDTYLNLTVYFSVS